MDILHQLDAMASFIWKDAVVVFAIVWVHEGTRILAAGGQQRRGIKVLLPGILVLVLMVSISFWVSHMMGNVAQKLVLPFKTELPPECVANMAPEKRESSSRAYASMVFTQSGKLGHYFDQAGGWKPYCPTEQDIALRDQSVVTQTQLQQVDKNADSAAYSWLIFGLVAALIGWSTGRKERKTLTNRQDERRA